MPESPSTQSDSLDDFDEPLGGICMRAALPAEEREAIREATEALVGADDAPIRPTSEWVELILAEADARLRRRAMAVVKVCPHCGEVLPMTKEEPGNG